MGEVKELKKPRPDLGGSDLPWQGSKCDDKSFKDYLQDF